MRTRFFPGLLIALSMFVSCISELRDPELSKSEIVFTAMTEPQLDSRTSIEAGTQVYWEPDDEITVFSGSRSGRFVSRLSAPVATASFYGSMEGWSSAAEVLALYPESEDAVCSGGLITTTLPSRQYARAGSFAQGTNLAVARSTGRTLQFYNVGGGVRFTLAEEGIRKVVFESLGDEWLAGKVRVGFEDGRPKVLEVTEGSRYVTLIPPDGETFETGKWYYIVAIPGALESGYKLKFYKDEVYAQRVSETAVTIKRSIYGSIENADAGLEYESIPNLTEWTTDKTMRGVQYSENAGGEGGEGGEGETGEIVNMPPEALFVMDDLNDLLQSFDDQNWTITYNDGPALTEADIKVGDVLYSMPVGDIAPEGYILRVTGVRKEGDRVVYDVEPAGLADAFTDLETSIPLGEVPITEDNFTVYDPFKQLDLEEDPIVPMARTRALIEDITYSKDRFKLDVDKEEAKITVILIDGDENLKTKDDQLRLVLKAEYEWDDIDLSFHGLHLTGEGEPDVGFSISLLYKDEEFHEYDSGDLKTQQERKKQMQEMEKKLVGKKFKLASFDIPIPASCKILVKPRIDFYVFFTISLEGELEVSVGLEKKPLKYKFGNQEDDCTQADEKNTTLQYSPSVYYSIFAECDLKASAGTGLGLVVGLSKVLSAITYENTDPFFGFFWEYSAHFDAKVKYGYESVYAGDNTYSLHVTADAYTENTGYLETDIHFKKNFIFKYKYNVWKIRLPEKGQKLLDTTFKYTAKYPSAVCVSPENGNVANSGEVELKWDVPSPSVVDNLSHFIGLRYDVYASKNKTAVERLSEEALIASRLTEKKYTINTGQSIETWYWRVVIHNSLDCQFFSPVFRFDTGYDGEIKLTQNLINYLKDNFETIPDLRILADGRILRTPSNLAALRAAEECYINDPDDKYWIIDINPLLAEMTNLTHLNCGFNSLSSLDLSNNRKLKNLSCQNNDLKELNITGLSSLESINCSENFGIEVLDVASCPSLEILRCSKCQIEDLDLSNCQNLTDLFAAENRLDSLDISRCPNLIRLDIYAQYKERLKLRLTQLQYDGFALFKRHFNTDLEFVGTNGVEIIVSDITNHSATVKVTMLDRGGCTGVGLFYSILEGNPSHHSNPDYVAEKFANNTRSASFTLENLRAETGYFLRGYALDAGVMHYYLGNTIHIRTLQRDPAPELSIIPENVHFGEVDPGRTVYKDLIFKNTGEMDLTYEIPDPNMDPFSIKPYGQTTLHPGDSVIHTVAFFPKSSKEYDAYFTVKSNDYRGDQYIYANGKGAGNYHPEGIPDVVDMGLSVHWASFNLGATQPEERGSRFAWGETNTWRNHGDVVNPWAYYKWSDADDPDEWQGYLFTKYCFDSDDGYNGFTDEKSVLDAEDDAAKDHLGGYWRMPTMSEWIELSDNCTTSWSSNVVTLTSKKNGKCIYLPITSYWSSSLYPFLSSDYWNDRAGCASTQDETFQTRYSSAERWMGLAIRPVYFIPIESVSLNESQIEVNNFQRSVALKATVSPIDAMHKHFVWEADIPNVVYYIPYEGGDSRTVSFDGAIGSTTVTVYADDGKHEAKSASCRVVSKIYIEKAVIVTAPDGETYPNYEYNNFTFRIIPGEKLTFNAMYLPENASEFTDTKQWVSDDPSIATVSDSGVVTGVKSGSTVIRVRYKSWNNTYKEDYNTIIVTDPGGSHEGFGSETWD